MASLFVVRGRDQGKHFQLTGPVQRIGRDASSEIQLLDQEASRTHAEIRVDASQGTCELIDRDSSNGTLVNGERVRRRLLRSGDRVEIGGTLLIFTGTGRPAAVDPTRGTAGPTQGQPIPSHGVDIVTQGVGNDASRIVSSLASSSSLTGSPSVAGPRGRAGRSAGHEPRPQPAPDADRSLEVMYRTAIAVGRSDNLDEVLRRILKLVFDWVDADRGCVMLRDPESGRMQPAARCDRERPGQPDSGPTAQARISISHTILDYVLERKEGVRTSDASDDERFESAASVVQAGVREALCVPLQGRYDVVGALYIDTFTSPGQLIRSGGRQKFTDDHLRLITAIGHQAALAIEDTFYYSALVQSERLAAMGKTIATLSHHVKNILQGIRGGSYLIEAGLDRGDTDAIRRGWSIVDRNQERISNLVLDMLTFSKEREPERVEADLNETLRDVLELMQTPAADAGVALSSDLDPDLPPANFDPDALHRAALNLVTNAVDAASPPRRDEAQPGTGDPQPPPGSVLVRSRHDPAHGWIVDVIDNGPGVPPEDREKIFSLFESRKGARGTGLGLPVSDKILREHGGQIEVLDGESGAGSCFRMTLPPTSTGQELAPESDIRPETGDAPETEGSPETASGDGTAADTLRIESDPGTTER